MSYFLSASKLAVTEYAKSVNRDHKNKHEDNVSRSSDSGGPPVLELSRSLSHESNKDRKESSRNSDRSKKKSSWYNALYPTYKSRSEDFRRIFKDVPPEERLVVDYSCALQKDILVHGRLYVSQNYLCFYANIFRWETLVSLKWKDVTAITKEKTALVIPNAVLVCTETDKLFFTSFGARDKTYLMLFRVWQNALMDQVTTFWLMLQQMSMQEMWQWVHSCYGEELGLTSDDEDYIHPVLEEDKISNIGVPLSVDSFVEEFTESPLELPVDCHLDDSLPGLLYRHQQVSPHSPGKRVPGIASISLLSENLPTDMSDTTDSDADKHGGEFYTFVSLETHWKVSKSDLSRGSKTEMVRACSEDVGGRNPKRNDEDEEKDRKEAKKEMRGANNIYASERRRIETCKGGKGEAVVCSSQHEGRKIVRSIFPVHIDQLFTLLFTSSKFFLDFHTIRRTSDMNLSPWQQSPDSGLKQRVVTLTMPLSQSVGPKSTHVCETQIMLPCSKPGQLYAIDSDSVNSGIPYADSFYVTTHYCISRTGENECCLAVYCQIKYKKNVKAVPLFVSLLLGLLSGFIEKNTWSGLEDFHTSLTKALQVECDSGIGLGVKKKVRRRRRGLAGITPAEVARPIIGLVEGDGRTLSEMLSWGVMAILVFLVCLNALLYYKLWVLEEWTQNSSHSFTVMDLQVLRYVPTGSQLRSVTVMDLHVLRYVPTGSQIHSFTVMDLQVLRYVPTGSQVHSYTVMDPQVLRFSVTFRHRDGSTCSQVRSYRFSGTFLHRDGSTGSQVRSYRFSGTFLHSDGSTGSLVHSFTVMDLQVLWYIPTGSRVHSYSVWSEKNPIKGTPPKSQDEWLRLLQQQEALHNVEMQKWQKVLQAAVQLLRQTEESLSELQVSIHPLVSKKVLSVLKDTFAEEAAAAEALRGELPAEDVVTTETSREEL
uniref:VASt domain-containing protein n=1 Tax=Timema cristinae TaxID=61476 RepID=A0A7R9GVS9_TIMCR|nr:unnamed protein product [Timema cristinae]